jgi:hypothetical protein
VSTDQVNGRPDRSSERILESTMSLVGRLEDLSLGEILQIVSLSKRSGLLRLESPEDKANIFIRAGEVIYAARSDEKEGVVSLLVHHGLIELDQIENMRAELESRTSAQQLRDLLDTKLGITPEAFQQVLKKRVQELVYSLFHWDEGTFSFQLIEKEEDHPLLARMTPFFLEDGIGAQFLVMEGARRKDELGRELSMEPAVPDEKKPEANLEIGVDWEKEFEQQLARDPAASEEKRGLIQELKEFEAPTILPPLPEQITGTIILIGLNRTLAAGIANGIKGMGITLLVHEDGAEGLTRIQELRQNRINPFLILDVEAAGITDHRELGGLEILSTIWDLGFSLHVGLVHRRDLPAVLLEKLDRIPGIHLFPVRAPADEEQVIGGIVRIFKSVFSGSATTGLPATEELAVPQASEPVEIPPDIVPPIPPELTGPEPLMPEITPEKKQDYFDIQQELSDDLEGIDLPFESWEEGDKSYEEPLDPHMAQLSSYVSELNRQDISGEITLLALRFASSFVSRAVLFLVRKEDLKGLGQFGVDLGEGKDADSIVRSLTIPMVDKSVFKSVAVNQRSFKGPPTGSDTEQYLFDALGGEVPGEIYLGPIISMGKVAVLLYGDDHPGDKGIEPTHTLDIFLSHVGLALDRAFLEMKLRTQNS